MSLAPPRVPALEGEFNHNRNARYLSHYSWEEILSLPCQTASGSATFFIAAGAGGRALGGGYPALLFRKLFAVLPRFSNRNRSLPQQMSVPNAFAAGKRDA